MKEVNNIMNKFNLFNELSPEDVDVLIKELMKIHPNDVLNFQKEQKIALCKPLELVLMFNNAPETLTVEEQSHLKHILNAIQSGDFDSGHKIS
jgi:hypothetical protein